MSFTRDNIQGFIDGYVYAGGDPTALNDSVLDWIGNHPTYKAGDEEKSSISDDLNTYRVSDQGVLNTAIALKNKVPPKL